MYCQKDFQNKTTFQVEKEENLNVTAHSILNLYSLLMQSLFPLLLLPCGASGAGWKLFCPNVCDKGHCWFVEVDSTVDCLFIQSHYMLEALLTEKPDVCSLFEITCNYLNHSILNL